MNPITIETKKLLRKLLRNSESHKGDFGHVLVVAGNIGFGGAALLSSKAAIKIGAGLVSLATRSEHLQAALSFAPEVMTKPVDSGQSLENYLDSPTVICLGPGLGKDYWSEQMIYKSLENTHKNKTSFNNFGFNLNRYVSTYKKSNQVIFMIGNQTCSQSSYEYLPLKILEAHLSYGMSSVLFKLFREKNGLTYDIGVFNPRRKLNSPFLIHLSVSNKNALLAFKILSKLWEKLLSNPIADDEINLAKEKLKSSYLISKQNLDEILERKIQLIADNMNPNFDLEFFRKIEKINSEDILKITNKFLSKPFLSIYGDKQICNKIYKMWLKIF